MAFLKTEIANYAKLENHPHIVPLIDYGQCVYEKEDGKKKEVAYIVFELQPGGEIFDFILEGGALNEAQARYYFKQLLEGLKYCHDQGVVHRDLKPENLLFDSDYNLKIADFGISAPAEGRDKSGFLTTYCGTPGYMAPEMYWAQPYNGKEIDLFASAVILFMLIK